MQIAALILGILGGLFGLLIGLFGYAMGGIGGFFGIGGSGVFQFVSIAIPIAALVGGGMATAEPTIAGGLMMLSAIGMLFIFGFNFFTAIPLVLSAVGGTLAVSAAYKAKRISPLALGGFIGVFALASAGLWVIATWPEQKKLATVMRPRAEQPSLPGQADSERQQRQVEAERQQRQAEAERQQRQAEGGQNQQEADQEQRAYTAARGNLALLRTYANTCKICAFASTARSEIIGLEATEQEERTYFAARGNLASLRAYVSTCKICGFETASRAEISRLEAAEPKQRASSIVLCGRRVDYVMDNTGITEPYRSFIGAWAGGVWNSRICGGLIIEGAKDDGLARIKYVYGPLPGTQLRWRLQSPTGQIRHDQLSFQDEEGGTFVFSLTEPNRLRAHFTSANGNKLETYFTREISSVP